MKERRASDGYVGLTAQSGEAPLIQGWYPQPVVHLSSDQGDDLNAPYEGYRKPRQALIVVSSLMVFISLCIWWEWTHGQATAEASSDRPPATSSASR